MATFRNMPILTSLSSSPPDNSMNKPSGTSLFDRIQQFKEISKVKTEIEIKEENNVPVKIEAANIKTENIQNHEDGIFRCQYCIFEGKTSYILQRHVVRHTGPLKCSKCNRGFSNAGAGKDYHKKHEELCDGSNPLPLLGEGNTNLSHVKEQRIDSLPQKAFDLAPKTFVQNSSEIVKNENMSYPSQIIKKEEIQNARTLKQSNVAPKTFQQSSSQIEKVSNPSPIIKKEETQQAIAQTLAQSSARNSKFQEYFLKQCSKGSIGPAPSPVPSPAPRLFEEKPPKESAKRKSPKEAKKSPKKQPERNQFGPKGNKYEKFWCIGCNKWLPGGKASTTSHLRNHHEGEECSIIFITNQGMLKVDKDDFILDKNAKKAKYEADNSGYNSNDSSINSTLNSTYDSSFNNTSSSSSYSDVSF